MTPHQWFITALMLIGGVVSVAPLIVLIVVVSREKPLA